MLSTDTENLILALLAWPQGGLHAGKLDTSLLLTVQAECFYGPARTALPNAVIKLTDRSDQTAGPTDFPPVWRRMRRGRKGRRRADADGRCHRTRCHGRAHGDQPH